MSFPGVITDRARISSTWEVLCAGRNDLTPFQRPEFLSGLTRSVPWAPILVDWDQGSSQWAFLRKRGPSSDLVLPPFCPFSSLLFSPESTPAQRATSMETLGIRGAGLPDSRLLAIDPQDWAATGRPSAPPGLTQQDMATWVINLAPLEDLMQDWSASARRTWRKHKDDYHFAEGGSVDDLVELVAAGYARHGKRLPIPGPALISWSEDLIHTEIGRLYTLMQGSTLAAGVLILRGPVRAWYWLAGSFPGPAMTVLLGHLLPHLHDQGVPAFDFMGANTPGISEFKRRFGGSSVSYPHWLHRTPTARLLEKAARIRQVWRR